MIASAVAGRQPLCCDDGRFARLAISKRPAVRRWLAEVAYERAGCNESCSDEVAALWLDNILSELGCQR